LKIYQDFDDVYEQAGTWHQLGMLYQDTHRYPEAETAYQQALKIYQDFDDVYEQAGTYNQLGRLAIELEQYAEAEGYLLQSLRIFVQYGDEDNIGITLSNLHNLHKAAVPPGLLAAIAEVLGVREEVVRVLFERWDAEKKKEWGMGD
jgi:tetratricopeptide (TPR) repeat protein